MWGYLSWAKRDDLQAKINEHILNLVQLASRGGNYLPNISPIEDGSVVEFEAKTGNGNRVLELAFANLIVAQRHVTTREDVVSRSAVRGQLA
jgi:hypothetical protein